MYKGNKKIISQINTKLNKKEDKINSLNNGDYFRLNNEIMRCADEVNGKFSNTR